jgi:hypothetical protein
LILGHLLAYTTAGVWAIDPVFGEVDR